MKSAELLLKQKKRNKLKQRKGKSRGGVWVQDGLFDEKNPRAAVERKPSCKEL